MVGSTIPTYHIKYVKLLLINLSTNVPRTKQALGYPKNNNVGKPLKQILNNFMHRINMYSSIKHVRVQYTRVCVNQHSVFVLTKETFYVQLNKQKETTTLSSQACE